MYMTSITKSWTPINSKIGTFIKHALVDAVQIGRDEIVQKMVKSIIQLTQDEDLDTDLLSLSILLAANDVSVLEVLEDNEFDKQHFNACLSKVYDKIESNKAKEDRNEDIWHLTELEIAHSEEVPCLYPELYQECENYCAWQKKLNVKANYGKFNTLRRYCISLESYYLY